MFGAFSSLVTAVVSVLSSVWEAAVENPRNTVFAIAAFLLWVGGVYGGYWYRGTLVEEESPTWVEYRDDVGVLERLLGGTKPDDATRRAPPDSSEVDTVRVRVPEYITKTDTVFLSGADQTIRYDAPRLDVDAHLEANPYGFLLLPTPNGRPSVRVTSDRTRIRTIDPRDASELQLTYDHPEDRFRFGPLVRLNGTYTPEIVTSGTLGGWVRFRGIRVDGGYRFASPSLTGPTLSAEWSPDINPF